MKRRSVARFAVAVGLVLAAALTSEPAPAARPDVAVDGYGPPQGAPTAWAWTQLVPGGTQVRYATPGNQCPDVEFTVGGQPVRHSMVLSSTLMLYPREATVCARMVDDGATAAKIVVTTTQGITVRPDTTGVVPLPRWSQPGGRPENIAVIGDSGCRIPSAPAPMQRCTPAGWPFKQVSDSAARRPARPDLVIHVGDYLYRSAPQRQRRPLCGDASLGNDVHTWGCLVTDFFEPAAELLKTAPFVFVRGNHENCGRAGSVWFRYLAADLKPNACDDYSPPVRINAGRLGLLLMDTSCASDEETPRSCNHSGLVGRYTAQFNEINSSLVRGGDNFLLSHTPLWAVNGQTGASNPEWIDRDLDAALTASSLHRLDSRVTFVLSGHVHLYQMLAVTSATTTPRPPQLTVGAAGTTLDQQTWVDSQLINKPVDNLPIAQLVTRREWGYAVLRDRTTTWNVRFLDQSGTRVTGTNCNLVGSTFPNCR